MQNNKPLVVAGWVDETDSTFEYMPDVTEEQKEEIAQIIINYLIEKGQKIEIDYSGNFDLVPVLSNGYKIRFSARGWIRIMTKVTESEEYYKRKKWNKDHALSLTPVENVDFDLFDFETEVYSLDLPESFDSFDFNGIKTFDLRPENDITKKLHKFDLINFNDIKYDYTPECGRVVEIVRGRNFEELLEAYDKLCYYSSNGWAGALGYENINDEETLLEKLYADYPKEEVEKNGAVLIKLDIRY